MTNSKSPLDFTTIGEKVRPIDRFTEILAYLDLLVLFVKRDFITLYKQTILGPLWYIIQPILTTFTFTVVFGGIAGISTDGIPKVLFYLVGITFWTYFSESLTKVSDTFYANQRIFSKVYFPRLILPLSTVASNLLKFGIQFLLFLSVYLFYVIRTDSIRPTYLLFLLPVLILIEACLALGLGMIITAMTNKYRDLKFLVQFGVQLLMYASPIVYPLSVVSGKLKWVILANPMTGIIETAKYAFFGVGEFEWWYLLYSAGFAVTIFVIGFRMFGKVEKNFVDNI